MPGGQQLDAAGLGQQLDVTHPGTAAPVRPHELLSAPEPSSPLEWEYFPTKDAGRGRKFLPPLLPGAAPVFGVALGTR